MGKLWKLTSTKNSDDYDLMTRNSTKCKFYRVFNYYACMTKKKTKHKFYKYFWLLHSYENATKINFYWHSFARGSGLVFFIILDLIFVLFLRGSKLKFYVSIKWKERAFLPTPIKKKLFSYKIYEKLATGKIYSDQGSHISEREK